jgi:thymidylate synthase
VVRQYHSLESAFLGELALILDHGTPVAPRGAPSLECTDSALRIADPRARLILNPVRRWSLPYGIGETLWHLSGSKEVEFIAYYSRRWRQIVSGARTVHGSCYGARIFGTTHGGWSRWDRVKHLLRADRSTRRAILPLFSEEDLALAATEPDVPCCTSLQFLVREEKLCLTTTMRSNDIMVGFGYDVFFFTMLQELMALELGLNLGWYQHIAGSMHLYAKDEIRANAIIAEGVSPELHSMGDMTTAHQTARVLDYERAIRQAVTVDPGMDIDLDPYWAQVVLVLLFHKLRKLADRTKMLRVTDRLADTPFGESVRLLS